MTFLITENLASLEELAPSDLQGIEWETVILGDGKLTFLNKYVEGKSSLQEAIIPHPFYRPKIFSAFGLLESFNGKTQNL